MLTCSIENQNANEKIRACNWNGWGVFRHGTAIPQGTRTGTLTLGNAKTIDIIVDLGEGNLKTISVKSVCGGGKWGVGKENLTQKKGLLFVFLLYEEFDKLNTDPQV